MFTPGSSAPKVVAAPKVVQVNHVQGTNARDIANAVDQPFGEPPKATGSDSSISDIRGEKERSQRGTNDAFTSGYKLLKQLGSGASGTVWLCNKLSTGETYAAKIIDLRPFKLRERFSMARVRREVDVMRRLRHPSIIALFEVFESEEQLILVLEYAQGVELFDAILAKKHYPEDEARPIFVQIARALQYMHSMNIVHRDVKPENVMVEDTRTSDGLYPQAKLLDFGLSKVVGHDGASAAKTFVGTPCYLAPEVELRSRGQGGAYGTEVDCWSLGAVLFVMLAARFPEFHTERVQAPANGGQAPPPQIRSHVKMIGAVWDSISEEAKDLIRGLMRFTPGQRMTATQALQHPWVTGRSWDARPPSAAEVAAAAWRTAANPGPKVVAAPHGAADAEAAAAAAVQSLRSSEPVIQEIPTPPRPGETPTAQTWHKKLSGFDNNGGTTGSVQEPQRMQTPQQQQQQQQQQQRQRQKVEVPQQVPVENLPVQPSGAGNKATHVRTSPAALHLNDMVVEELPEETDVRGGSKRVASDADTEEYVEEYHSSAAQQAAGQHNFMQQEGWPGMYNSAPLLLLQGPPVAGVGDNGGSAGGRQPTAMQRYGEGANLNIAPLLYLHNSISACLETAVESYSKAPAAAGSLRRSALLCRENLLGSMKLLRKIEQTATQVLDLFPDLALAIEEKEPALAKEFFATVRAWVGELYKAVTEVQEKNSENTLEINELMGEAMHGSSQRDPYRSERSSRNLSGDINIDQVNQSDLLTVDKALFDVVRRMRDAKNSASGGGTAGTNSASPPSAAAASEGDQLTEEQIMDLFLAMAKPNTAAGVVSGLSPAGTASAGGMGSSNDAASNSHVGANGSAAGSKLEGISSTGSLISEESDEGSHPAANYSVKGVLGEINESYGSENAKTPKAGGAHGAVVYDSGMVVEELSRDMSVDVPTSPPPSSRTVAPTPTTPMETEVPPANSAGRAGAATAPRAPSRPVVPIAAPRSPMSDIAKALQLLQEVDAVLEQLALFWANTEVIFDVLLRKGDLVEKFVAFADKPRLLTRFHERMVEYKRFWEGIKTVCNQYINGEAQSRAYKFLDGVMRAGQAYEEFEAAERRQGRGGNAGGAQTPA